MVKNEAAAAEIWWLIYYLVDKEKKTLDSTFPMIQFEHLLSSMSKSVLTARELLFGTLESYFQSEKNIQLFTELHV